jgi:hypothetical protein
MLVGREVGIGGATGPGVPKVESDPRFLVLRVNTDQQEFVFRKWKGSHLSNFCQFHCKTPNKIKRRLGDIPYVGRNVGRSFIWLSV